jgi:predicted DNA-binding transcriptional regulator YafY
MSTEVAFSQRQRLQFIESVAFWEGAIARPRVAQAFDVSENHITKDFGLYKQRYPGNLDYDLSGRAYRPGKKFKPQFSSGSAEEYLALLRASQEGSGASMVSLIGEGVSAEILPTPVGRIDPAVLKEITRALHQGRGLRVTYQSLQTEQATQREVWPHALVLAGTRWHVRVFDSRYEDFVDLVLQRILKVEASSTFAPKSADQDRKWQHRITINLAPRAELMPAQQEVIAREFGMNKVKGEWRWRCEVRECLVPYFLESMALGRAVAHFHPKLRLIELELLKTHSFSLGLEMTSKSSSR